MRAAYADYHIFNFFACSYHDLYFLVLIVIYNFKWVYTRQVPKKNYSISTILTTTVLYVKLEGVVDPYLCVSHNFKLAYEQLVPIRKKQNYI